MKFAYNGVGVRFYKVLDLSAFGGSVFLINGGASVDGLRGRAELVVVAIDVGVNLIRPPRVAPRRVVGHLVGVDGRGSGRGGNLVSAER